jgi:hypothetical protein
VGVEAFYVGAAPGYKLKKTAQADAGGGEAAAGVKGMEKAGTGWSVFWRR